MLLEDFYQIKDKTVIADNTWKIRLELNPRHPVYEGHFPAQPVLPGVGTLQIIREVVSSLLDKTINYSHISTCKFLSAIDPKKTPELEFSLNVEPKDDNQWLVKVDGEVDGELFIKLKATVAGR